MWSPGWSEAPGAPSPLAQPHRAQQGGWRRGALGHEAGGWGRSHREAVAAVPAFPSLLSAYSTAGCHSAVR